MNIKIKKKIILYGAGKRCRDLCKILHNSEYEIVAVLDSIPDNWGRTIEEYHIGPPGQIRLLGEFAVCITVADINAKKSIRNMLCQTYQYDLKKEVNYNSLIIEAYKSNESVKKMIQKHRSSCNDDKSVLFDSCDGLGLGGVQTWTMDICNALIGSGEENIYIISDQGDYEIADSLAKRVKKAEMNHAERFSFDTVMNLIEIIMASLPCKIVTSTTNEVMLAAYLIKMQYPNSIEIISVIHNSNENVYEDYIDFRECPDFYIGVSRDIVEDMIKRGVGKDSIASMSCPFLCDEVLERSYTEDSAKPVCIGYAGRMVFVQKRMDLLLACVEELVERNVCFRMELAGDGEARQEMEEFIRSRHLEEKVRFVGRLQRDELMEFWKRQDVCVNFSDFEGRCISIIEAMGNGAVPVVTGTSGVREDIIDGVNGYIVPVGGGGAVAKRIAYLAQHREKLKEMGRMSHDIVYPKSRMEDHLRFWKEILKI